MQGVDALNKRLKGLTNEKLKTRILQKAGRLVVSGIKKRISQQVDVDGQPFAARKRPKRKSGGRMFVGLKAKFKNTDPRKGFTRIYLDMWGGFQGPAAMFNGGATYQMTAAQAQKARPKIGPKTGRATRQQAEELRTLGFRRSVGWIQKKFTESEAGHVIKKIKAKRGLLAPPKQSWTVKVPARRFFGITAQEQAEIEGIVQTEIREAVKK